MIMFEGFDEPRANWSKLPHSFIDALPYVETVGELKVILYILRHTWGFQDDYKKLTLDEFENGRKRRDSSRFDNGIGLSRPTIRDGIERAICHGFINVETDERDLGRIKKFYSLRMFKQGERNLPPGVKNLSPKGKETCPRTEKETLDRNQERPRAGGETSPVADYLGDIHKKHQEELKKNDERQRGYRDATEEEYRICQRVADLWMGGKLQHFARDIEKAIAGANYILQLHDDDLRAALWTIDEYHAAQGGEGPTITSPHSLRNVLPGFMAKQQQSAGPIRIER
jgi:hypothetical protein